MHLPALDPTAARALGVLIEKELTTPEQYPLSLNALTAGCNQKSNRHPVAAWSEREVAEALERLRAQRLALVLHTAGGRVERYQHNAKETLGLQRAELAVLAELLLRGPQQPGELRARAERMAPLPALEDLAAVLEALAGKGMVRRLEAEPGARAARYDQCLSPALEPPAAGAAAHGGADPWEERLAQVEAKLERLHQRVEDLERNTSS